MPGFRALTKSKKSLRLKELATLKELNKRRMKEMERSSSMDLNKIILENISSPDNGSEGQKFLKSFLKKDPNFFKWITKPETLKPPKAPVIDSVLAFQQSRRRLPNLIHYHVLETYLPETNLVFEYLLPVNLWFDGDAVMNSEEPSLKQCMRMELVIIKGQTNRYTFTERSWKIAALKGDFAVIKHLHRDGIKGCTHEIMDIVAEQNYVDILRFLIKNRVEGCSEKAIIKAAENGHLLAVEILYDCLHDDPNPDVRVMDSACKNGHTEVVTFLLNNKFKYSSLSILYASEKGFFDILRLLDDHRSLSVEEDDV